MLAASSDPILVVNEDGVILLANKSWCDLLGYAESKVSGQTLDSFYHPDQNSKDNKLVKGGNGTEQKVILLSDVNGKQISLSSNWFYTEAPFRCLITFKYRSTKEPNIPQALMAQRLKQEFLASISHEMRTPLNTILGFSRLLMKAGLEDEMKEYSASIYDSGEILLSIINDILDFSQLNSGEHITHDRNFSLARLLKKIEHIYSLKASEKSLQLLIDTEEDIPDILLGDDQHIYEILAKLVDNGIKFTNQGFIDLKINLLDIQEDEVDLEFRVSDTGIGITEEQQSRMFSSFTQVDNSYSRPFGGTGLGLAIVKQLVHILKGSLEVNSDPGTGTTFAVRLTLKKGNPEQAENDAPAEYAKEPLKGFHLLVVDDNRGNRTLAEKVLMDMGAKVNVAVNGLEAVEMYQKNNFDLIFMDVQMPVMDGMQATRKIRSLPKGAGKVPIIALTAHSLRDEIELYREIGMNAWLPKPLKEKDLMSMIAQFLPLPVSPDLVVSDDRPKRREGSSVTDLSGLYQLAKGSFSFIDEMICIFLQDVKVYLERVEGLYDKKDWTAFSEVVHKLKGPIELMGITILEADLDRAEFYDPKKGQSEQLALAVENIKKVSQKALEELEAELKKIRIENPESATNDQIASES